VSPGNAIPRPVGGMDIAFAMKTQMALVVDSSLKQGKKYQ
jgi:hypothetical protein